MEGVVKVVHLKDCRTGFHQETGCCCPFLCTKETAATSLIMNGGGFPEAKIITSVPMLLLLICLGTLLPRD